MPSLQTVFYQKKTFSAALILINVLYPWVSKQAESDIDVDLLQVDDSQEFQFI